MFPWIFSSQHCDTVDGARNSVIFRRDFIRIPGGSLGFLNHQQYQPSCVVTSLVTFGRGLPTNEERTNCSSMMRRIASNLKQRLQGSLRHCIAHYGCIMDHYMVYLPSWELRYPPQKAQWKMICPSPGRIC